MAQSMRFLTHLVSGCNFNLLFIETVFIHSFFICYNVKLFCKQLHQRGPDRDRGITLRLYLTYTIIGIYYDKLSTVKSLV